MHRWQPHGCQPDEPAGGHRFQAAEANMGFPRARLVIAGNVYKLLSFFTANECVFDTPWLSYTFCLHSLLR